MFKKSVFLFYFLFFYTDSIKCMETDDTMDNKKRTHQSIENFYEKEDSEQSNKKLKIEEEHEKQINPPLPLDDKYAPTSILIVAKYLIFKEAERIKKHINGEGIDRMKIQKLLHYAQSYFYALHGKPLFEEKMFAFPHGCYSPNLKEWDVYTKHGKMDPLVGKDDVNKYMSSFSPDKLNLYEGAKNTINSVFELFLYDSGLALREKNHQEVVYKNVWEKMVDDEYGEVPLTSLTYYRQPKKFIPFEKIRVLQLFKENKIEETRHSVKWGISNYNMEESFSYIQNIQESIQKLDVKPNMFLEQWPQQSYSEAVYSSLLFPYALRQNDELLTPLLWRGKTASILAILAKLNNPEGKYYLSQFLDLFYGDDEKKSFREQNKYFYKLKEKLRSEASTVFKEVSKNKNNPPFLRGLSFLYEKENEQAKTIFQESSKEKYPNPFCLYNYVVLEKESYR